MPDLLTPLLTTIPNLAIAVWVLIQYQKTIDKLLDNQQKLLDQLMAMHPPQTAKTAAAATAKDSS